jgi:NADPH:quinone reductase-like Zn-dependent oxidoreductase
MGTVLNPLPSLCRTGSGYQRELGSAPAASSSVSLAANNLAHYLGARTIGISRTAEKRSALGAAAYDELVISNEEEITARILEITGGGADFVFDPVGGRQLEKLVASVKRGAPINVYGVLDSSGTALPIFPLMNSGATLSSYTVYELLMDPPRLKAAIEYFLPLFETGKIAPVVDQHEFSLDHIVQAFQHLESNTQLGKVVVNF